MVVWKQSRFEKGREEFFVALFIVTSVVGLVAVLLYRVVIVFVVVTVASSSLLPRSAKGWIMIGSVDHSRGQERATSVHEWQIDVRRFG